MPLAKGSGFTLHLFRHVWRTLRIAATVTKSLALVGAGQRAGRRLEEEEASVVGPHGAEDAFVREAFGGGDMDPELDRDLCGGEPPGLMEMLGQARNPIGLPNVPDHHAVERLSGAGAEL